MTLLVGFLFKNTKNKCCVGQVIK